MTGVWFYSELSVSCFLERKEKKRKEKKISVTGIYESVIIATMEERSLSKKMGR